MSRHSRSARPFVAGLIAAVVMGSLALATDTVLLSVNDTIWVANRGTHTIRGFDAVTGEEVQTVAMAPNSQPGDLAYAKGKLYVAEEFGTPPAIAIVAAETGVVLSRIVMPTGSRPHHMHASVGGNLVAVGLFGTDMVAVVDTHDDTLLGPWDSNPLTTTGRVHAPVFSKDGERKAAHGWSSDIARADGCRRHADLRLRARQSQPAGRGDDCGSSVDIAERALHIRGVRRGDKSRYRGRRSPDRQPGYSNVPVPR